MLPTHRPYAGDADLRALLTFLSECTLAAPERGFMHPGDLSWWLRQNEVLDPAQAVRLFHDGSGHLLGFVFTDPRTWAVMQAAPDAAATVLDAMIDYALMNTAEQSAQLTFWTFEGDTPVVDALHRAGFRPGPDRTCHFTFRPAEQVVPFPVLPAGFKLLTVLSADPDGMRRRVELHRAVWHPSRVTLPAYTHLRQVPGYDADLDVVVAGPDGTFVASALGWYDPASRAGIMEPVGTHPNWRGRGLGRVVVQEVTRRLAGKGATGIVIRTPESKGGAVKLYASAGFRVTGFLHEYRRP